MFGLKIKITIVVIVSLLISSFLLIGYFKSTQEPAEGIIGITVLEGKNIADALAFNLSGNCSLHSIKSNRGMIGDGEFVSWTYVYINYKHCLSFSGEYITFTVFSNGTVINHTYSVGSENFYFTRRNITVDSDQLYYNASTNSTIVNFINKYEATLDYMELSIYEGNVTWQVSWSHDIRGDPSWSIVAFAILDPYTGEIKEAYAEMRH
jgi:hypothetical protein